MSEAVRPAPCSACPYRRDVPSGVWAREEYEKLRAYDGKTWEQPPAAFLCHEAPGSFCHGWAVVHSTRGHEHELLALRIRGVPIDAVPAPGVLLFGSGCEAADHGLRDVARPSTAAVETGERLLRKSPRLRRENPL